MISKESLLIVYKFDEIKNKKIIKKNKIKYQVKTNVVRKHVNMLITRSAVMCRRTSII